MKLITRILLIFLVAISFTCSAQEYTIDDAGISFKIPQGFSIIDPKIKDPNIDERAYAELKRQKAILYLYNLEKRAEIYIVYAVTDQTKKASDYFHLGEKLDTKMYTFFKEELAKKMLCTIDDVSVRTTYAARYIEVKGHNDSGSLKSYLTVKNGASYGINGTIEKGQDPAIRDYALEIILSSIKYKKSNVYSDTPLKKNLGSSGANKKSDVSLGERMAIKGLSGAFTTIIVFAVFSIASYLLGKVRKSKKED